MNNINSKSCKECLASKVINALPKCDRPNCITPATRYEIFDETDDGIEFKTYAWRCEEHKFTNGVEINKISYAKELLDYLESIKKL